MDLKRHSLVFASLGMLGDGLVSRAVPVMCQDKPPIEVYGELVELLAERGVGLQANGWGEAVRGLVTAVAIAAPATCHKWLEALTVPIKDANSSLAYHRDDAAHVIVGMIEAVNALDRVVVDAHVSIGVELASVIRTQIAPVWRNGNASITARRLWERDRFYPGHQLFTDGLKQYMRGSDKDKLGRVHLLRAVLTEFVTMEARDWPPEEALGSPVGWAMLDAIAYALFSVGSVRSRMRYVTRPAPSPSA